MPYSPTDFLLLLRRRIAISLTPQLHGYLSENFSSLLRDVLRPVLDTRFSSKISLANFIIIIPMRWKRSKYRTYMHWILICLEAASTTPFLFLATSPDMHEVVKPKDNNAYWRK